MIVLYLLANVAYLATLPLHADRQMEEEWASDKTPDRRSEAIQAEYEKKYAG